MKEPNFGLRWQKLDLHVHTPASADYSDSAITPEEFVQVALNKGLDGIAITDHNCAGWIDRTIAAAKPHPLAVFPGVEITANGGTSGIHIIALFDRDETSKTVESLLAKLQIEPSQQGKNEALTSCSAEHVIEIIAQMGGLAVLAHADSTKGVLADMKGEPRTRVIQSRFLSAAELCNYDKSKRYLDGTDPVYKRHLATYRASDNPHPDAKVGGHDAQGIANRYSWFKMDGFTLASLAQCFADPEVRIVPDSTSLHRPDTMYPRITSVRVSQGFLSGPEFKFHHGLNAVIGGKGVGKSLLVEVMRFALDQPSPIKSIYDDMRGKLAEQVGLGGTVRVEFQLEADRTIVVERTLDGAQDPISVMVAGTDEAIDAHVAQLFPILAYSQTEALEIAKDPRAQLQLIDTLLDIAPLQSRIAELRERLLGTDQAYCVGLRAREGLALKRKDVETLTQRIAQIDRALKSTKHEELTRLEPKTAALDEANNLLLDFLGFIDQADGGLETINGLDLDAEVAKDAEVKAIAQTFGKLLTKASTSLTSLRDDADKLAASLERTTDDWQKHVSKCEADYRKWAESQGGDKPKLSADRKRLQQELSNAEKSQKALNEKANTLKATIRTRQHMLVELEKLETELSSLRAARYSEIQTLSHGKLELSLQARGDREGYLNEILALKKGTNLQESTIRSVVDHVLPAELVAYVLASDAVGLAKQAEITEKQAEKLIAFLSGLEAFDEVLAIEHSPLCIDKPEIRYQKEDGKYHPLGSVSIGQKCTALLIVALSDGDRPIIIDQPEDALDTPSVYSGVTQQLRAKKERRQFIVTTHNSTVAVAGDTDHFQVLTATADRVQLAGSGAMDRPTITTQVIQHLEGGQEPLDLKGKKYRPKSNSGV